MKFFDRGIRQTSVVGASILMGFLAALYGLPAGAQENLYANKTPAQIFASDCAICHKSPQGLSKAGGMFGLGMESFLREHYTASRESAAALARYIQAMDSGPAAPAKNTKRAGSGAKPSAKKSSDAKPAEAKAGDGAPANSKPADKKAEPAESKAEVKTEAKPEPKPEPKAEVQPETKPAAKPSEPKPAEPAKPEKSD
jgi:hypothetical protein